MTIIVESLLIILLLLVVVVEVVLLSLVVVVVVVVASFGCGQMGSTLMGSLQKVVFFDGLEQIYLRTPRPGGRGADPRETRSASTRAAAPRDD